MPRAAKAETPERVRADGRRALLVYLLPDLIKDLKKAALDLEKAAYEIAEDAIKEWLNKPKRAKQKR